MNFDEWLQKELDKRAWNQTEFARRTGIPRGHVSRLLNGSRNAGPEPCIAIAEAFGLSRQEVFRQRGWLQDEADKKSPLNLSDDVVQIAAQIDQLPTELRQMALDITKATADAFEKAAQK